MTKIHVCCGGVYLKGYVNIDKYPFEAGDDSRSGCVADLLGDVFDLPYAKGSLVGDRARTRSGALHSL